MENHVPRLLLERAFPREARRALDRDLAQWYLLEINGLGDVLRSLIESYPDFIPSERLHSIRARLHQLVDAFGAAKGDLVPCVWGYLEQPLDHPEDAFAPVVLLGVHDEGPRFQQWTERLTAEEREAISLIKRLGRGASD